jgi:hypothetical protein
LISLFDATHGPYERLKKMIRLISMLVNQSGGCVICSRLEASFPKDPADPLPPAAVPNHHSLPLIRSQVLPVRTICLIGVDQTL